jgi:aromatic ring-opening dioxygenase catalytic subunit (LigB family)
MARMPTYYISHSGGPWPWMPDWLKMFKNLAASLIQMTRDIERPEAVLVISGHWEEDSFAFANYASPLPIMQPQQGHG